MTKGQETRDAILETALRLATEVGLEGLTIGRLAEELDLSKSGLFAHFRSKEALQVQTLERAAERFAASVLRPALAAPRGLARLRSLFDHWLRWPHAVPRSAGCIFVAAAAELDDRPGPARDVLARLQREWVETLASVVRGCVEKGELRKDVAPEQLAFELYGIMLSFHHASRLLRDDTAELHARRAFDRLIASARPKPS